MTRRAGRSTGRSIGRRAWALLGACVVVVAAEPVRGQSGVDVVEGTPVVVRGLLGGWEGSGELMGRPGAFRMRWEVDDGGFLHLGFDNGWSADDGAVTPVLSARALYRITGVGGTGVWLDSRPQQIRIDVSVTDSSLVSEWTADAEQGRTEYVVHSPDSVTVRDWVYVDGEPRLFGEATYRRAGETPGEGPP
jgi:hypothetical protein